MLAREVYLPIGFDHAASLNFATEDLLNHELRHARLDVTGLRLEAATGPSADLGRHDCAICLNEETLCNAAIARAGRKRAGEARTNHETSLHQLASRRLEAWLTAGPLGADDITAITLLCAPEGIKSLEAAIADLDVPVSIVTGAMDEKLNERGYIVPGLGDAGDRLYGVV